MKPQKALKLFGISPSSSLNELNDAFRKLAKRYHPDFNRERESWANRMMTELNLAYEAALDFLTTVQTTARDVHSEGYKNRFLARFNRGVSQVLRGVYTYYQYGLENIYLRGEGVRRFRYTDSLSYVEDGILNLEDLRSYHGTDSERNNLQIFTDFSKAFFKNMLIHSCAVPVQREIDRIAYRHYSRGSEYLDYAIKGALFGDLLIQVRNGSYSLKLSLSYEEFMIVLTRYHMSNWVAETVLKLHLWELFKKVIRLSERMRF